MGEMMKYDGGAIANFLRQPENIEQFTQIMGHAGKSYVQSVIIAVANNEQLMACTPPSIMRSALRAASLELSCDPSLRQAYLIPRNRKVKGKNGQADSWVKEAQFQPHYNGLYTLAMRTGKYWVINVSPVYEGSEVYEDMLTGLHTVQLDNGLMSGLEQVSRLRKVSDKNGKAVIGWLGYFKTKKGSEKSVYMTVKEIEGHAAKFSDSYGNAGSLWKNAEHRPIMQMKTVLIALLKWADMSGSENTTLRQALDAESLDETVEPESVIDAQVEPVTTADEIEKDYPPMPADWQAAKAAKEAEEKKPAEITRPYPPEIFREKFSAVVAAVQEKNHLDKIGEPQRKIVASAIDGIFEGEKTMRYEVCNWLTGSSSTKDMTKAQIRALMLIMGVEDFNQAPKAEAIAELKAAHAAALVAAGQLQFQF